MADPEQSGRLRSGTEAWNAWRRQAPDRRVDLSWTNLQLADVSGALLSGANLSNANLLGADLRGAILSKSNLSGALLSGANLSRADLSKAILHGADLTEVDLSAANLSGADLSGANLSEADLSRTNLGAADLSEADLSRALLSRANLDGADLCRSRFLATIVSDVDLSGCKNLAAIHHVGPSSIDIHTLQRSGTLPLAFLRGVGLPDTLIEYLPSLLNQAIQHYSCFISYSSQDDAFAHRLHADLQDKGVRCWFAPEDMKIGAKIRDTIDNAIRLRDKVLLVLSETSIASDWVEDEVDKAFEEERHRGGVVLFPVRLDDTVMETKEAWAAKLRRSRNIGDFRAWKEHDAYQAALKRVLRDLQVQTIDATGAA